MAPPRRFDLERAHPAIDIDRLKPMVIYNGHQCMAAPVICPDCGAERWYPLGTLRQQLKRSDYAGRCKPCGHAFSRINTAITKRTLGGKRRVTTQGYIALSPCYVSLDDLPMFDAMRCKANFVFEHRWVMAKHLGRPLRSNESIDHRDGDKTHNAIENLRLYLRGKNQEGSGNGYGTYYHEWQMAEARIKALEHQLALTGTPV